MRARLKRAFFQRDVLEVAPELLGKHLVMYSGSGEDQVYTITETEAYRGGDDMACHASKGRTARTDVMFGDGGYVYMYLIYGMHWMLNVVTSIEGKPQAVLIRGLMEAKGPGRLSKMIGLDKTYNREDLVNSERIGIHVNKSFPDGELPGYTTGPRIGIDYAGEPWKSKPWRFLMNL